MIPEFAIMGHPNEGKSSVLSTLAEDDSVRVSSTPGETIRCQSFVVHIDNQDVLRFTDTPGFQNPTRILYEIKKETQSAAENLLRLVTRLKDIPDLEHDIELLRPLLRGAGIIYVVDGSRAPKNVDLAEIEILRLTGRPRMAVINCKENLQFIDLWKDEFRKSFNSYRVFNAHKARYIERLHLLETLKSIEQEWQEPLEKAILAFRQNWKERTNATVEIISSLLEDVLSLTLHEKIRSPHTEEGSRKKLFERYCKNIEESERRAHKKIRTLYRHTLFDYKLPPPAFIDDNLFSDKNWQVLGLSQKQLMLIGGASGAGIGVGLDLALAGLTFGIFTAAGTATGALAALFSGRKAAQNKSTVKGIPIAQETLSIGPAKDITLLFVLLNRAFIFYNQIINWAHGRRDEPTNTTNLPQPMEQNFTRDWSRTEITTCKNFFSSITKASSHPSEEVREEFHSLLKEKFEKM